MGYGMETKELITRYQAQTKEEKDAQETMRRRGKGRRATPAPDNAYILRSARLSLIPR